MSGSRVVRKIASRPRTSSDTPSQTSWCLPSGKPSTRRITHSASRITTRAPGAWTRLATEFVIDHPRAGGSPTGSSGAIASGSVLTTPSNSGYRTTISSRHAPATSRPSWCFSVAALATAFAAKWLFM